jgi:DNA-binding response OmpR family regulator
MFKIIIAEDDKELRGLYAKVLRRSGYDILEAADGEQALNLLEFNTIDLLISDIMMPKVDGYELVSSLRRCGINIPVLMITAKDSFTDLQMGFLSGTDDYMVKPININEMKIRVQALLRRSQMISERRYSIGNTTLDYDSYTVTCSGIALTLPQKEFQLLYKMAFSTGKAFSKMQLMDDVWGVDSYTDPHTLEVHIGRLREKLINNPDIEIVTIRGLGYKVVKKNVV